VLGIEAVAHGFDRKLRQRCVESACARAERGARARARRVVGDKSRRLLFVRAYLNRRAFAARGETRGGVERVERSLARRAGDADTRSGRKQGLRA